MLDLTSLVKKPPGRGYAAGVEFQWRKVVAAIIGVAVISPMAALLFRFGIANLGLLVLAAGAGAGLLALTWRPDGLPFSVWARAQVTGRRNRTVLDDGTEVSLHVGLAPVRNNRSGQKFDLVFPAVEVTPDRVGPRGDLLPVNT